MKTSATLTALLLATTLGLQAQTTPSSSSQPTEEERRKQQQQQSTASSSGSQSTPAYSQSQNPSSTSNASQARTDQQRREQEEKNRQSGSSYSSTQPAPPDPSQSTEQKYRSNQPTEVQKPNQGSTSSSTTTTAQTGTQASTQTNVAVTGQVETEVRTVVQQIDAQGPVVVERISAQFADAACTEENARALVEALHSGTSVTLRGDDGTTATFTPTTRLGYGDAYIALSVAVQALRDAGITGCASPAQWQAVLLGGQLSGPGVRTTSVTTTRFPGVLVLHSQGGWSRVAQTTNVQLNQVVSQASSSLQINNTAQANTSSTSDQQNLSPTGRPGGYDARTEAAKSQKKKDDDAKANDKDKKDHDPNHSQRKDPNSPDTEIPPKSETPPKY